MRCVTRRPEALRGRVVRRRKSWSVTCSIRRRFPPHSRALTWRITSCTRWAPIAISQRKTGTEPLASPGRHAPGSRIVYLVAWGIPTKPSPSTCAAVRKRVTCCGNTIRRWLNFALDRDWLRQSFIRDAAGTRGTIAGDDMSALGARLADRSPSKTCWPTCCRRLSYRTARRRSTRLAAPTRYPTDRSWPNTRGSGPETMDDFRAAADALSVESLAGPGHTAVRSRGPQAGRELAKSDARLQRSGRQDFCRATAQCAQRAGECAGQ